jgi:exopolysaccharide biosynthesis polyprenyl glycosylphosphotransferase
LYVREYWVNPAQRDLGYLAVSQPAWVIFLGLNVVFTYLSREVVRDLLHRRWRAGIGLRRVLIVGGADLGRMVADRIIEHSEMGFRLAGFVDDRAASSDTIGYRGLPVLGTIDQVPEICAQEKIDEIYVALPIEEHVKMLGVVEFASRECINIHVVPDLLQFIALRARLEDLDGLPIIGINDVPLRGMNSVVKRCVDIAFSSSVVLIGAVPALIIAAVIKRSSPGPVFYRQLRMGLDGKAFTVYKFRSMPVDAEDASGPVWAREDDPRATPIGKWLRRRDVDELPQFWNVLRGDMALIGPRPLLPQYLDRYTPAQARRHEVRPGITGLAQVLGRNGLSWEERFALDVQYVDQRGLGLDLWILYRTVVVVVGRQGISAAGHATMPEFQGRQAAHGGPQPQDTPKRWAS